MADLNDEELKHEALDRVYMVLCHLEMALGEDHIIMQYKDVEQSYIKATDALVELYSIIGNRLYDDEDFE